MIQAAMRGYDQEDEYEDYDDYEDEQLEEGEGYEEEEGEEYVAEEPRKPTKEELDYLELRQKLKESIRKKMQKQNSTSLADSSGRKKQIQRDNYGSFFGPSQPVIAQRVIQESKSLLENRHLVPMPSNTPQIVCIRHLVFSTFLSVLVYQFLCDIVNLLFKVLCLIIYTVEFFKCDFVW